MQKTLIEMWKKSEKVEGKNRDWLAVHTEDVKMSRYMVSLNCWKGRFHTKNMLAMSWRN